MRSGSHHTRTRGLATLSPVQQNPGWGGTQDFHFYKAVGKDAPTFPAWVVSSKVKIRNLGVKGLSSPPRSNKELLPLPPAVLVEI